MNVNPASFAQIADAPSLMRSGRAGTRLLQGLAEFLERHPIAVLAVLSVGYFWLTTSLASLKLLWDDEFFTLYLSYAGYKGVMEALATGADQHPPVFYWITYALLDTFGYSPVTLRMPATVGFWAMLLCLFAVVSRHRSNLLGYLAFLLPATTSVFWYAYEARGYGLMLGFTGTAFLFWDLAIDRVRRGLTVPLFGASLALAVCAGHYYGILIVLPFAFGTFVYMVARRKIDFWLVVAHAAPLIPIVAFWSSIRSARGYSAHFWAKPQSSAIEGAMYTVFTSAGGVLLVLLALLFAYAALAGRRQAEWLQWPRDEATVARVATAVALALLPIAGYLVGAYLTNAFNPRYVVTSVVGTTLVFVGVAAAIAMRSKILQMVMVLIAVAGIGLKAPGLFATQAHDRADLKHASELIKRYTDQGLPMAIAEVTIFHKMAYYGEKDLKGKFFLPQRSPIVGPLDRARHHRPRPARPREMVPRWHRPLSRLPAGARQLLRLRLYRRLDLADLPAARGRLQADRRRA